MDDIDNIRDNIKNYFLLKKNNNLPRNKIIINKITTKKDLIYQYLMERHNIKKLIEDYKNYL